MKKPICLNCEYLVWHGFLAECGLFLEKFLTSGNDELFNEWTNTIIMENKKKEAVLETQMDLDMEKRIEDKLITAFPYVVWKRRGVIKYHENAPTKWKDCPFR